MKKYLIAFAAVAALALPSMGMAHSPLFDCYDNGDGTIMCQGGFSDGSSASGVNVVVLDASGKVIENITLDANSECMMKKPSGDYSVRFDAGEGHSIEVKGENIVE